MINQRDIVLICFPFSNGQRSKLRPVLVISNDIYNKKLQVHRKCYYFKSENHFIQ
jgi:mRNA-degrading endonuclease toxin of MazEF toxin-antitoxin module